MSENDTNFERVLRVGVLDVDVVKDEVLGVVAHDKTWPKTRRVRDEIWENRATSR